MDANKKYKPEEKTVTIEVIETTFTVHKFVMPKKAAKPKHVADFSAKFVEFFDMNDKFKGASSDIYGAGDMPHKLYKVNLRGELCWNDYYSKLKEIQPDIKILSVFCTSEKACKSKTPLFRVFRVSPSKLVL